MAKKKARSPAQSSGKREERAKKPIIRENTAGCHPQSTAGRRSDEIRRPSLFYSFPSWRLSRETASPFTDFMTNLLNDRPDDIYGNAPPSPLLAS